MPVLWSHWDGQNRYRKVRLEQDQGQENWELQLGFLSAQGTPQDWTGLTATDSKQQLGADLLLKPELSLPQSLERLGHTPGGPCCTPKLHRRQSSEPSGLGEEPTPLLHALGTPLQPPSGVWGLQCQRNTCTHLSTSKHVPKIQSFHFSHSLPALHCGSLLGILGFCASFWLLHGQLCSGGWIW